MQSTTKVQSVTFTRGEFSLILDHGYIMYILGLLCNVTTLALNVMTSQRRDVSLTTLWNVATLIFTTLWNVATLDPDVAALDAFLSGTSRRRTRTSRR